MLYSSCQEGALVTAQQAVSKLDLRWMTVRVRKKLEQGISFVPIRKWILVY